MTVMQAEGSLPSVSVVYVSWNARPLLRDSLRSLFRHACDRHIEVVVVDNGSTDGTAEWLRRAWPQVKLVELEKNYGFAVGNNRGFEVASGDYVLLLNTDTIVMRSTIPGMARLLDAQPRVGCVGARHLNEDRTLQRSMDSFPNVAADLLTYTEMHRIGVVARHLARRHAWWGSHDEVRFVDWVNGACMMVRRTVIEGIGGLDPDFFIYGEEIDWCARMRHAGWHVVFTPSAEIVHLGGRTMDHIPVERSCLKHEGLLRLYDRHLTTSAQWTIRAVLLTTIVCRAVALGIGEPLLAPFGGSRAFRALVTQLGAKSRLADAYRAWWRVTRAVFRSYH